MIDVLISKPRTEASIKLQKEKKEQQGDRPLKSLLKTISWRVVGTLDTITISYIITGEITSALSIGSIEVVSKMILYYFHERAWSKVKRLDKKTVKATVHNDIISGIGHN
jgi:uncharacterized membrane protein